MKIQEKVIFQKVTIRWLLEIYRYLKYLVVLTIYCLLILTQGCWKSDKNVNSIDTARNAYLLGQYTDAERWYENYLQKNPQGKERWEAWNRIMDIALSVRMDNERAVSLLDTMLLEFGDKNDKAWQLFSLLAEVYENMQQWDKAVVIWQKSLNLPYISEDRLVEIRLRLVKIFKIKKDYDLAQDILNACYKEVKDNEVRARCAYEQAQVFEAMANTAEAKRILQEALTINGVSEELRAIITFMLVGIYEHEYNKTEAMKLLLSIQDTYPNPRVVEVRLKYLHKVQ